MTFSASIFASIFSSIFDGKWLQKPPISSFRGDSFSIIFAIFSKGRLFDAFWSPVGSPLAPFWHPLAAFWLHLVPFWLPLAPFWLPFGSLGLPLATFWVQMAHFWRPLAPVCSPRGSIFSLFGSPGVVFGPFLEITWKMFKQKYSLGYLKGLGGSLG